MLQSSSGRDDVERVIMTNGLIEMGFFGEKFFVVSGFGFEDEYAK